VAPPDDAPDTAPEPTLALARTFQVRAADDRDLMLGQDAPRTAPQFPVNHLAVADGRKTFEVSLVTPEGMAYEGLAEMLVVPGAAGEIGVLARHAPLVAMLKAGSTRVHVGQNEVIEFATGPGFFKVEQDRALALVDDAVDAREVDTARAQLQLEEATAELERVEAGTSDADRWQLEQRVRHAENQLSVAGRA